MPRPNPTDKAKATGFDAPRRVRPFSPRGSALLYVIASIALLGALGGGVAYFSSSSSTSQLARTRSDQAYYAALAGQEYVKAHQAEFEAAGSSLADFLADLATNSGIYTLDATRNFTLAASQDDTTHYSVTIVGERLNTNGEATENFSIDLTNQEYASSIPTKKYSQGSKGSNLNIAGYAQGDSIGDTVTINSGSVVIGNITSLSSTTALRFSGGVLWSGDQLCSNDGIDISGGVLINGDIHAHGNVVISSAIVNGNIYALGTVEINGGSTIFGDIHSQSTVTLNNGLIWGDVYTKSGFTKCPWCTFTGHVYTDPVPPDDCAGAVFPEHEVIDSSTDLYITEQYTFYGSTDINDKSNAYKTFKTDGWADICFDLSTPGSYVNIFVNGDMLINGNIYVKTSSGNCFRPTNYMNGLLFSKSDYAERIYVDVNGTARLGGGTNWIGTIYAKGNIYPGGGSSIIGGLYSSEGEINPENSWYYFKYVDSLYLETRME